MIGLLGPIRTIGSIIVPESLGPLLVIGCKDFWLALTRRAHCEVHKIAARFRLCPAIFIAGVFLSEGRDWGQKRCS